MSSFSKLTHPGTNKEDEWFSLLHDENYEIILAYSKALLFGSKLDLSLAEDILQEVFIVALKKSKTLHEHPNPVGWLKKVAYNIFMEKRRKNTSTEQISLEDVEPILIGDTDVFYTLSIQTLLSTLSKTDYDLIYDYAIRGMTIIELSNALSVSPNSIRIRIHKIRKKLKEIK